MKRLLLLGLMAANAALVATASADMTHYDGSPSGTWGWSSRIGSGQASQGTMGGGHLNPTNDGFASTESSPATSPIERSWFYWRKGSNFEIAINSTQSSNSIQQSEQTATALPNVTRTMVTNQKDLSTGTQILQFTITSTLIPISINSADPAASQALYKINWSVKNISTLGQAFSFYYLADLMATRTGSGGNSDDTLSLLSGGIGQSNFLASFVSAPGTGTIPKIYVGAYGQAISSAEFSTGTTPSIRTKMTNTSADTLTGSTVTVTGNAALGLQYNMDLAVGATRSGTVVIGYNAVPEPGTLIALGAGLAAAVRRRRRRA